MNKYSLHKNKVFKSFSLITGFIALILTIILFTLLLFLLKGDLATLFIAVIGGILFPISLFFFSVIYGKNHGIKPATMFIRTLFLYMCVFFFIFALRGFNFELDPSYDADFQLIVFLVIFLLITIICAFSYGIYHLNIQQNSSERLKRSFITISLVFLVLNGIGLVYLTQRTFIGNIQNGTGFNDGPWVTWQADPTQSVTITWLTAEKNSSSLLYGTDPSNLQYSYYDNQQVNLHNVILTSLLSNTSYFYRISERFDTPHASDVFHFKTAPATESSFRFAVFGDKQPTNPAMLITNGFVADGIIAQKYDFVCQIGDLASSGTDNNNWHLTFDSLSRIGATAPLMMVIGNHDWAGGQGATNWRKLFNYPFETPLTASYYSLDYAKAHFIMIDNFEQFYRMSTDQMRWIENDITSAKTRGQKWIFCLFHLTLFTTATSGMYQEMEQDLLPIFDKTGVDAVFFGHDHHYEHYNYTYGANSLLYSPTDTWNHHAVQYFCTGGGGANLEVDYGVLTMENRHFSQKWFNQSSQQYQTIMYEKRAWNASRFLTHPSFSTNYSQYSADGTHNDKYYYYAPDLENYCDYAPEFGFTYGEQAYHFLDITVEQNHCIIQAVYPNGELLKGPIGNYPQKYIITK